MLIGKELAHKVFNLKYFRRSIQIFILSLNVDKSRTVKIERSVCFLSSIKLMGRVVLLNRESGWYVAWKAYWFEITIFYASIILLYFWTMIQQIYRCIYIIFNILYCQMYITDCLTLHNLPIPRKNVIFSCYCCIPSSLTSQQQLPGIKRELMPFASFSFYSLLTMAINRFLRTRNETSIDVFSSFASLQMLSEFVIEDFNG